MTTCRGAVCCRYVGAQVKAVLTQDGTNQDTVVAVHGIASLFGFIRVSVLQGKVLFGGALSGRDITATQKTVSGLLKLLYPDPESFISDEDLEWAVELALESRRRVKEQQKRIGSAEFRNTHFGYIMGEDGVEKFVVTPELHSENMIGTDPLPPGRQSRLHLVPQYAIFPIWRRSFSLCHYSLTTKETSMETLDVTGLPEEKVTFLKQLIEKWREETPENEEPEPIRKREVAPSEFTIVDSDIIGGKLTRDMAYDDEI